jgi:rod shape determining protein RodA
MSRLQRIVQKSASIDWVLFLSTLPLLAAGLVTMNAFGGVVGNGVSIASSFFTKQLIWILLSFFIFFGASFIDFHFLRKTSVVVALYTAVAGALALLFVLGTVTKGAASWFHAGGIAIEPSDPAKLVLIVLLAKYFSRRHIEIRNLRHIVVSGFYAFVLFVLIAIQPDLGAAVIVFMIWLGMTLISGLSKKHLFLVFFVGALVFGGLWMHGLKEYQKQRILTFLHPLAHISSTGYNAYQSTVAVGSGGLVGKGVGFGTQSRLNFLPEYQTDFIFAAFTEEWGFVGALIVFSMFGILIWRILANAVRGESNFEILFGAGLAICLVTHFVINIGMNVGILPVTGITLPFLSYGGSHLLTEYLGLGILMGMRRYNRAAHKDIMKNEFLGLE